MTKYDRTLTKRSVVEAVAIAIASSDWTPHSATQKIQALFRRKRKLQPWINSFVHDVIDQHRDRISLARLIQFSARNPILRQAIKDHNLQPISIDRMEFTGSLAALDWCLPKFSNPSQFADQLGISLRELEWLASISKPPGKTPRHYVATWIRKRSSGLRLIESPKTKLKNVQQIILRDILNMIPAHEAVHGFCRQRNVCSFVTDHTGKPFCLRMDLRDFFPAVSGDRVFGLFRSAGYGRNAARIFTRICTTETPIDVIQQIRPPGVGGACEASRLYLSAHLPQGAPTSPALANLAAYNFDCRLSGLAASANAQYSRYADDLLFSGDANFARAARRFAISVGSIAIEEGFEVNFRKTRYQHESQRQLAAGVVLNSKPNVKRVEYDRLKAILRNCLVHGADSQNREAHSNFRQHLIGKINWVRQLNPQRADKLQRIFDQIEWNRSTD